MQTMINSFMYLHAKKYQSRAQMCKVFVKKEGCNFLVHSVQMCKDGMTFTVSSACIE